jgi:predicted metal-binding membrane protein
MLASQNRTTILLFGAAAIAWAVTAERMNGMDAGPGTDLGGLGWYLGVWVTMTAAMMLPSTLPVARVARGLPLGFVAGYLAAWTAYGVAAYGLFRLVISFDADWLPWDRGGPFVAGGVIVAAGLYELTPFKDSLLRRSCSRSIRRGTAPSGPVLRTASTASVAASG